MVRFVLDTDICIYWLKGHRAIERRLLSVGMRQVGLTVVTACELAYGAWKSARRQENLQILERVRHALPLLHTTDEVIERFGQWKAELEGKGAGLDDADLLIAAITHAHHCTLVTNNRAHFSRLPGLRIENWFAGAV